MTNIHRWTPTLSLVAAALLVCASAGVASAQSSPKVSSPAHLGSEYTGVTGPGFGLADDKPAFGVEAGEFIFLPRLFLEAAYSTNFYRRNAENGPINDPSARETEIGLFQLHIRPGLGIYNPAPDRVAFSFSVDANVWVPFATEGEDPDLDVGVTADAAVHLFPKSVVSLKIHDRFDRRINALTQSNQLLADSNTNRLGGNVYFRPGGKALEFKAGYRWAVMRFDDRDYLDRDQHETSFLSTWTFYPHTAAFLEADFDIVEWRQPPAGSEAFVGNYIDMMPLKVMLGLTGHLTDRFSLVFRGGYGNTLMDGNARLAPADFSSFIGMLEGTYRFTSSTAMHLGASRDFSPAALGGYMSFIRGYLGLDQKLGKVALLHLDVAIDHRNYGEWAPATRADGTRSTASDKERVDDRLHGGLVVDFDIWRVFGLTAGYRFEGIFTDYALTTPQPLTGDRLTRVGYFDHRFFVSLNLRY